MKMINGHITLWDNNFWKLFILTCKNLQISTRLCRFSQRNAPAASSLFSHPHASRGEKVTALWILIDLNMHLWYVLYSQIQRANHTWLQQWISQILSKFVQNLSLSSQDVVLLYSIQTYHTRQTLTMTFILPCWKLSVKMLVNVHTQILLLNNYTELMVNFSLCLKPNQQFDKNTCNRFISHSLNMLHVQELCLRIYSY